MALILETGAGVANAESYIDAATARAYALKRGVVLPAVTSTADPVEVLLILAIDYLQSKQFIGASLTTTQALAFPRRFCVRGVTYAGVPTAVQNAQAQLVVESNSGVVLLPSTQGLAQGGGVVIEETVGPITTRWSDKIGTASGAIMPAVDALLRDYLTVGTGAMSLRVVRL